MKRAMVKSSKGQCGQSNKATIGEEMSKILKELTVEAVKYRQRRTKTDHTDHEYICVQMKKKSERIYLLVDEDFSSELNYIITK